ncbi:hypothetical protein CN984_04700 [Bacillus cereus]|uniref:Glycosyltransferase 2-like domain-containing protein n=1 Tax=Bacillus cereus TaxID=1396 RepID=A0A2B9QCI0_BACCE|nr:MULTISPECIES: glycosyltransferase [Bacillus cereus group]PGO33392.1 hypothetical protein CN984_04700 [Bacillus cereus]UNP74891.1 glycosyltransferase [Bacillus nitratireducens]
MKPKISIIVPVYNVAEYLEKCVESILNQTFVDFELILVNDGSKDQSGEICDEFAEKDSRIKVIHKKNAGLSVARNTGINAARGEYIGFVDSDDWIDPDMYEALYESCELSRSEISIIGMREVSEEGKTLMEYIPVHVNLKEILKRAYAWNKLFKRELFVNNNLYFMEGKYYEDLELIPKLFIKCNKVTNVNKVGYNYLKRRGSITSDRNEKILDNLWAYTQIKRYLLDEKVYLKYKEEFENGVLYFKKYYINILYDYPTKFLISNFKRIKNDFDKIGGLKKEDYLKFILKHFTFNVRKVGSLYKRKLGRVLR